MQSEYQISTIYMVVGHGTSSNQPGWDRSPHYAETHNFSGKTFTDKPFGPQRNLHAELKNMGKAGSIRIATVEQFLLRFYDFYLDFMIFSDRYKIDEGPAGILSNKTHNASGYTRGNQRSWQ